MKADIVKKLIGFEVELGNHLVQTQGESPARRAGEALVAAHQGLYGTPSSSGNDSVHEFNSRGFRVYLDHDHAEVSGPLCCSATQLTLAMRDARRIVASCREAAEQEVGPLHISFNNTNRQGVAWAFHANFLVARRAFDAWRDDDWRPLKKQWVPLLVTGFPIWGTGKVGAENGVAACDFQLSQRADFIDEETGLSTIDHKNIINTRDQPLANPENFARLHTIAYDTNLQAFPTWLKFGIAQVLLALIEEELPMPDLTLKDPVKAAHVVSRDLQFRNLLKLQNGGQETALNIQRRLAEMAAAAIEEGCSASAVPDAGLIVETWIQTLDHLETRHPMVRRLDWVSKYRVLAEAQRLAPRSTREMTFLDLRYADVGGSFEAMENAGAVDKLEDFLPQEAVARETEYRLPREAARATLIKRFGRHLLAVDWDHAVGHDRSGTLWLIPMDDPLDGHDLLKIVSRARTWKKCLKTLIKRNIAVPASSVEERKETMQ